MTSLDAALKRVGGEIEFWHGTPSSTDDWLITDLRLILSECRRLIDQTTEVECTRCGFKARLWKDPAEPNPMIEHYEICPARPKKR